MCPCLLLPCDFLRGPDPPSQTHSFLSLIPFLLLIMVPPESSPGPCPCLVPRDPLDVALVTLEFWWGWRACMWRADSEREESSPDHPEQEHRVWPRQGHSGVSGLKRGSVSCQGLHSRTPASEDLTSVSLGGSGRRVRGPRDNCTQGQLPVRGSLSEEEPDL